MERKPKTLQPFIKMCATIGALPTSYLVSMTYEEQLIWLCNFLEKEVIPVVNNNSEVVKELQEWFENLDVQEEVNIKIEEMYESGQLQEIITEYLEINGVLGFNTIADMKQATNLIDGSICRTIGTLTYNDGKGNYFKIRQLVSGDVIDEETLFALTNFETLVAELLPNYYLTDIQTQINNIINNDIAELKIYVTPEMFGCVGDGTTDDTTNFQACVTYAKENNAYITSAKDKIYLLTSSIDVSNLYINLNHATVKAGSGINIFEVNTTTGYTNIENVIFDCNSIALSGLLLTNSRRSKYNNLDFVNVHIKGISTLAGYENMFDNINMTTTSTNTSAVGFNIETGDNHYTNICMTNIKTAFYITAPGGVYDKIHCWIGETSLIEDSVMFKLNLSYESYMLMTNIYNDTYQIAFKFENATAQYLFLDKFNAMYHTGIYTTDNNDSYIFYGINATQINLSRLTNCFIQGLPNNRSHLSNFDFYGHVENSLIVNENYSKNTQIQDVTSSIITSVSTNEVIDNGDTVTINFIAAFNSTAGSGNYIQISPLGTLPFYLAPNSRIVGECFITTSYWDYYSTQTGYLFIDAGNASNQIHVRVPRNNNGTNYLHINITYARP